MVFIFNNVISLFFMWKLLNFPANVTHILLFIKHTETHLILCHRVYMCSTNWLISMRIHDKILCYNIIVSEPFFVREGGDGFLYTHKIYLVCIKTFSRPCWLHWKENVTSWIQFYKILFSFYRSGCVTGLLKVGTKNLYVFDPNGETKQVSAPCVLDFYVHESRQRAGHGKQLFSTMLEQERFDPSKMAVDRPSEKLVGFLNKHYGKLFGW